MYKQMINNVALSHYLYNPAPGENYWESNNPCTTLTSELFHRSEFEIAWKQCCWEIEVVDSAKLTAFFAELNSQGLTSLPPLLILRAH